MVKKSKPQGGGNQPSRASITDSRFTSFETEPRHRVLSKHHAKTAIDKRFSRQFEDESGGFVSTVKIDGYGRKIRSDADKKRLKRLYRTEEEDDEDDDNDDDNDEETKVDDDEEVKKELRKASEKFDPARGGGFESLSESDSDEEDGNVEVVEDEAANTAASMQRFADEQADVEEGEVTRRIAIVNLDWDYIKSQDLLALFSSFLPRDKGGKIERVTIFPSEYGKERMQREEFEGPPKDIFKPAKPSKDDEDIDSDEEEDKIRNELLEGGEDDEFNTDALRAYQLDRLKYYYAIMECSDAETAQELYETIDGTEYLSSSNFLDLRFVPDDVTFDDKPRDSCTEVTDGYNPVEFVTSALQSSKVKLTWDMHPDDAVRKQDMQKAFNGKKEDLMDSDLREYLASDSDEDEAEAEAAGGAAISKKEMERKRLREALGLPGEPINKKAESGPVGEMQITFSSALIGGSKDDEEEEKKETTIEKYKRKEKERKEKRRQKSKAHREGQNSDSDSEGKRKGEDLGFEDPFFTTEDGGKPSKSAIRKEERRKKREAVEAAAAEKAADTDRLRQVMGAEEDGAKDFNLRDVIRAAKEKNKKTKRKKGKRSKDDATEAPEDAGFEIDDRFGDALANDPDFALGPDDSRFAYKPDRKVLEEAIRKRRGRDVGEDQPRKVKKHKSR